MAHGEILSFCDSHLATASFAVFDDMRKKTELCDITLKIRNTTFAAHRVILAAAIPYFRSVFTISSSKSEEKEIAIGDIDPAVLEALIHFAYTSRINISAENVQSLLLASEFLQVNQVKDACVEFLCERLDVNNVAQVRIFALIHNNTKLFENANIYIRQNFEEFCKSEGFLDLSHSCIKEIISEDDLRISTEEIVFEAVMNWVKFSPSDRGTFLPELLSEVRLVHLSVDYLIKKVACEELIGKSVSCGKLIQNAQSYHLLSKEESSFPNLKTQPRTCGYSKYGIYAVCRSVSHGYRIYYCELTRCTWNLVKSDKLQLEDRFPGVAAVDESIYLFFDNKTARFRLTTLEWDILNSTNKEISGAALSSREKMIYCFGSYHPLFGDKVRCFDTRLNEWLKEETMQSDRYDCASVLLRELLYVSGGKDKNGLSLNTVEQYNPETGTFSVSTPMLDARDQHGCTSLNGKIYVCGGFQGKSVINTAEVFDPLTNKWNFISANIDTQLRCSLIPQSDKIFAFQRPYDDSACDYFEIYDEESGKWTQSRFLVPSGFVNAVMITVTAK